MNIDLMLPWAIKPLRHKYYGTIIVNRDGEEIMTIWHRGKTEEEAAPSPRELYEEDLSNDEWKEWFDWSHYESMISWETAKTIVERVNGIAEAS